jgi:glutamate dehydrogenase/leucine dehydrogenase
METRWRALCDEFGPSTIVLVRDPAAGMEGVVVVDDTSAGPAIGGVRMAPDVTVKEVARLARAMTLKNAAAGLPHGGGKAGIIADPAVDPARKQRIVRAFARAIRELTGYVPGPDMGTDEACMAWIHDEIGRAVGLPAVLGGIPLDQIGATGFGLAVCADAVEAAGHLRISGSRVAIQGFGAVGRHAARFLAQRGARIVGVSDVGGAVVDGHGLDLERLLAFKAGDRSVGEFPGVATIPRDDLIRLDCDILIPAARPDVLTADNADDVKARLVLQGANIPATRDAEQLLHKRGVLCIPDFVANAGGVICAAVEYQRGTKAQAFALISERVHTNTLEVLARAREQDVPPREAAEELAWERIEEARSYRQRP